MGLRGGFPPTMGSWFHGAERQTVTFSSDCGVSSLNAHTHTRARARSYMPRGVARHHADADKNSDPARDGSLLMEARRRQTSQRSRHIAVKKALNDAQVNSFHCLHSFTVKMLQLASIMRKERNRCAVNVKNAQCADFGLIILLVRVSTIQVIWFPYPQFFDVDRNMLQLRVSMLVILLS